MKQESRTDRMESRRWGIDPGRLAELPTVYRSDLLAGQSFLISGAGSGMGRAATYLALRLGAEMMICGRNAERLETVAADTKRLLGREVMFKAINIRDPEQVEALMDEAFTRMGTVNHLINSAGGQFPQNALDFSVKGWNAVVDTNLNGTFYMMQAMARRWRNREQPGSIVNIVATIDRGIPQSAHTAAARAGVVYLPKSVAVEWAPLNIRVNCIAPGTIEIEGLNNYPPAMLSRLGKGNPMHRMGTTWDIAEAIFYLSSASAGFVTGELLHIDGGMQLWGTNWPLGVPDYFKEG